MTDTLLDDPQFQAAVDVARLQRLPVIKMQRPTSLWVGCVIVRDGDAFEAWPADSWDETSEPPPGTAVALVDLDGTVHLQP